MSEVYIYALCEPLTGVVRYVGKTTDPRQRLREHVSRADRDTHTGRWVVGLISREGVKPSMVVLEKVTCGDWQARERFWIAHYRAQGCDLTNRTDGGEGQSGVAWTPEMRAAQSVRLRGKKRTAEQRANMRAAHVGFTGRAHSAETRAQIAASVRRTILLKKESTS